MGEIPSVPVVLAPAVLAVLAVLAALPAPAGEPAPAESPPAYPSPERFAGDIAAFEAADRAEPPPRGAIVGAGSSSMRGWHENIREDLAPLTVIPRGFGGSTMHDLLHYADRIVLPYRPRAVLLYEGDNDIAEGIPPRTVADTFGELTRKIHAALPGCRIYALAIKPSRARWDMWPRMKEANRLVASACAGDLRLTFVDVASPMLGEDGQPRPELFLPDNLHLNRRGYELWRDILRPVLLQRERTAEPGTAAAGLPR